MVAISFSKFKEKVASGEKKQTIRKRNPNRIKKMREKGIQVYWKQRTTRGHKLFDAELTESFPIKFTKTKKGVPTIIKKTEDGWTELRVSHALDIAHKDGFTNIVEMYFWFVDKYGTLEGQKFDLIRFEVKNTAFEFKDEIEKIIMGVWNRKRKRGHSYILEKDDSKRTFLHVDEVMYDIEDWNKGEIIQVVQELEREKELRYEPKYEEIYVKERRYAWEK